MPLMLTPEGVAVEVPFDQVQRAKDIGYKDASPAQAAADLTRPESGVEGAGGAALAGLTSALSGATFGGSDVLIGAAAPAGDVRAVREARAAHPIVSTVSNVAGAVLPAVLTGGESLLAAPTRLAGEAGAAVARAGEAAGVGRIGGAIAGGATEGGLFGAGQGISELALSDDPLTVERVASSLSSNALYGAAFGAGLGGLGKAAELGLTRAKGAIDSALERRAAKAKTPAEAIESGDLQLLDKRTLDAAEGAELKRLRDEQLPQRKEVVDEIDKMRKARRDEHDLREIAKSSSDPDVREASGALDNANLRLRKILDEKIGFTEDPLRVRPHLRAQAQALTTIETWARDQKLMWELDVAAAPQTFRRAIQNGEIPGEIGPFTPEGLENATARAIKEYSGFQWNGSIKFGLKEPPIVRRIPEINETLAWNQRVQAKLDDLAKATTSERLTKIADARAILETPAQPSLGGALLSAAAPFAGPLGAAAAAGNRALGGFKKVAEAATTKAGQAVSAFLTPAIKAAKYTPPIATKILASVRFAERDKDEKKEPKTLPELYKARTDEVKDQIHVAADGSYQMRPAARAKLAARFDGIRAADPRLADQLETAGARRIEYLASIMPRLPDYGTPQVGPERRMVPDLQMRAWARAAGALEDPHGVLDRAAANGRVTPAEAAAIKAVYPELLASFTNEVAQQLPTLKKTLHRDKQLALTVLRGIAVDPALTPGIQRVIQGMYQSEPGTEGGTQAPVPEPQFGSVRADPGTKAQQRQGENA